MKEMLYLPTQIVASRNTTGYLLNFLSRGNLQVGSTHNQGRRQVKQESLANAKVNARQHCVSLSCLCNSLTQIEWLADFSLGDEDTKIGILDDHFLV